MKSLSFKKKKLVYSKFEMVFGAGSYAPENKRALAQRMMRKREFRTMIEQLKKDADAGA